MSVEGTDVGGDGFRPPDRLRQLPDYPLADAPEIVARLREEGRDVIDLGAGDPGLPVPEAAIRTLRAAAGDPGLQGYAFQRGLPEYRTAVADWMERRFGRRPDPDREVLPLLGSKDGVAHLAAAVLDPGERALVPDPGYAACPGGARLAGARLERVRLRPEDGFRVPPDRIREAESPLGLVYLNYPNNPTGATVGRDYLEAVVEACRERDAVLAWDNPYAEVYYGDEPPPGLLEVEAGPRAGVEFHSFSKGFNMTGWRLGWACGSAGVLDALARVKSFYDTGVFLPVQAAGAAALREGEDYLEENRARLRRRRDAAVEAFRRAGFEVRPPEATLYLWMPVPDGTDAADFARRVLEEEAVLLMPGSSLGRGGEGWVRAALAEPPERYAEAADRLSGLW
jgi:LL-diaminopimelate aminotransferase